MTGNEATLAVIDALEARSIPYMLVGSYSSNVYGVERSTQDAVFVVALGEGAIGEEGALARRLLDRATLPQWVEAWEAIGRAKVDAASLNLDRSLLLLEAFYRLQQAARGNPV